MSSLDSYIYKNASYFTKVKSLILVLSIFLATIGMSGCTKQTRPDLKRLYAHSQTSEDQPPVILIPGILGTRLADEKDNEIWVGSTAKLLTASYSELALPIDGAPEDARYLKLHPTRLTDKLAGRDFYASIENVLEHAGGYQRAQAGAAVPAGRRVYYEFAYDWRQDNVSSAKQLGQLIGQIRKDHGNPALKVDIIAHSMGGLIARYYLRYGDKDILSERDFTPTYAGENTVRRVALLGTPNLGSVGPLQAFISGKKLALGSLHAEVLATFPSVYQLFPHPVNNWIINSDGKTLDRDLFDIDIWRRFQWSIFDPSVKARILANYTDAKQGEAYYQALENDFEIKLERARTFVWSLSVSLKRSPWDIRVFGGDCTLTPARILVEEVKGDSVVRLWPNEISNRTAGVSYEDLMLEPGDGAVTKASLLARESLNPAVRRHQYSYFPVSGEMFLCEQHDKLSSNITFQDNLLQYLLSRDADSH
jgi:pimeloyl-ACP methyl ester carboxylesterase